MIRNSADCCKVNNFCFNCKHAFAPQIRRPNHLVNMAVRINRGFYILSFSLIVLMKNFEVSSKGWSIYSVDFCFRDRSIIWLVEQFLHNSCFSVWVTKLLKFRTFDLIWFTSRWLGAFVTLVFNWIIVWSSFSDKRT